MLGMAKRGETRPWRMRFEFENGICGTETFHSEEQANFKADQIRRNAANREMTVAIKITNRVAEREAIRKAHGAHRPWEH
jgi:hypothetical protein